MEKALTIVAVPDTHFPFADKLSIDCLLDDLIDIKPDAVVQMGDLYDLYSFSVHHPSRSISPFDEVTNARADAEAFWHAIHEAAPNAKRYQILGNHDLRIRKGIVKKAPEYEALLDALDLDSLWRFEGVQLHSDSRMPLMLGGVAFLHGFGKHGSHMRKLLCRCVVGHLHCGAVEFMSLAPPHGLGNHTIWELNCGFLGDKDALAFNYTPLKLMNWTHGYGLIDQYGPRFVPI